jgi:hypothetical protein
LLLDRPAVAAPPDGHRLKGKGGSVRPYGSPRTILEHRIGAVGKGLMSALDPLRTLSARGFFQAGGFHAGLRSAGQVC